MQENMFLFVAEDKDHCNIGSRIGFTMQSLDRIAILKRQWSLIAEALSAGEVARPLSDQTRLVTAEWIFDEKSGTNYYTDVWICGYDTVSVNQINQNGKRIHLKTDHDRPERVTIDVHTAD